MTTDPKTEPTDAEIVQALFERFGPREGNDGGHGRNIHYRLHSSSPTPHYHSGHGSQYFEWSPLTNIADLAPAVLETLRERGEVTQRFYGILWDLEWKEELAHDLALFSLELITDPETLPLVARAVVAAWGLLEENDD